MGLSGARNTPGRRAPICLDGREQRPRQPQGNVASSPQGRLLPSPGRSPPTLRAGAECCLRLLLPGGQRLTGGSEPAGAPGRSGQGGRGWHSNRGCPCCCPVSPPVSASYISNSVCFSQSESEEKVVTYDHIGPNVCMGDHKVTDRCGSVGGQGCRGASPDPLLCLLVRLHRRGRVRLCLILMEHQQVCRGW